MSDTTLYKFSPNPDTNSYRNRFMIVFKRQLNGTGVPVTKLLNQSDPGVSGITNSVAPGIPKISLYPNPVSENKVTLQFSDAEKGEYQVIIYNAGGEKLSTQKIGLHSTNTACNLLLKPGWPGGIYTVSIINEETGKTTNLQLVINR